MHIMFTCTYTLSLRHTLNLLSPELQPRGPHSGEGCRQGIQDLDPMPNMFALC